MPPYEENNGPRNSLGIEIMHIIAKLIIYRGSPSNRGSLFSSLPIYSKIVF
jgi:hypothetical protein